MPGLERFTTAQDAPGSGFDEALQEIRAGAKTGHWIWYVFPQLAGLGGSAMSHTFAIADAAEAEAYLRDPALRARLLTITAAVAEQVTTRGRPLRALMGSEIDARKLVSSLTLFAQVAKRLHHGEGLEACAALAAVADAVLARAADEGCPPCAFTLSRLEGPAS